MKGLWKNKLNGWNHKDSKRKSQTFTQHKRDNAKAIINVFNSNRNSPKLIGRNKPLSKTFDLEGWEISTWIYGFEIGVWEYDNFGLNKSAGSKRRKEARKELKGFERSSVKKYIHDSDWDAVISYRGQKTTVSWDIS